MLSDAKDKWLSEEALQTAVKRREAKSKGEKERYTHLNTEFQRIARRDKKAFLSDQCKEIEENNRMRKTRDLFKKTTAVMGIFHKGIFPTSQDLPPGIFPTQMGMKKKRNKKDLTEAEEIKKRWQE